VVEAPSPTMRLALSRHPNFTPDVGIHLGKRRWSNGGEPWITRTEEAKGPRLGVSQRTNPAATIPACRACLSSGPPLARTLAAGSLVGGTWTPSRTPYNTSTCPQLTHDRTNRARFEYHGTAHSRAAVGVAQLDSVSGALWPGLSLDPPMPEFLAGWSACGPV
jgi:hypothetical protein